MTAYSWTQAEVDPEEMPGSQTFFIQHDHTIEERYTEPPDPTNHPNGVLAVSSLSLAVKDADGASRRWMEAFGLARASARAGGYRSPDCALACVLGTVPWTSANRITGMEVARFLDCWGAGPYWIGFACEDLDATEELLRHNGVRGPGAPG